MASEALHNLAATTPDPQLPRHLPPPKAQRGELLTPFGIELVSFKPSTFSNQLCLHQRPLPIPGLLRHSKVRFVFQPYLRFHHFGKAFPIPRAEWVISPSVSQSTFMNTSVAPFTYYITCLHITYIYFNIKLPATSNMQQCSINPFLASLPN